jgi:hypothetical protein
MVNVEVDMNKSGPGYKISNPKIGMFSEKLANETVILSRDPKGKRITARDLMMKDMIEYHKKPNAKLLNELKARCNKESIAFD